MNRHLFLIHKERNMEFELFEKIAPKMSSVFNDYYFNQTNHLTQEWTL